MLREHVNFKEYKKNGNITLKYDKEAIESSKKDDVLTIDSILCDHDCYFIGDTYCIDDWGLEGMGHTVYNAYSDLVYTFPWRYIKDLEAGKMVRLHAKIPDEWDRELIEREGY